MNQTLAVFALHQTRRPAPPIWTEHGRNNTCNCSYCTHERAWMRIAEKLDTAFVAAEEAFDE